MAIKELQSIIQNSGNQQTGGSDISMEEFTRRNRESAEAAIAEYDKWKQDKLLGSVNAQQNLRNRYYDASGMDYFRRDFNDYVSAGAGMSDSDKIWEQNIKNQRDYFSRYAKYFSDDELRQFNGELDYYESIVKQRMENGGANEDQEYPEYITIAGYQSKLPSALVSGNRGEAFDISKYSEDVIAEHSGTILEKQNQLADSAKTRMDAAEKNVNDVDQVITAFLQNSDISFDKKGNIVFKNNNDRAQYNRLLSQRKGYVNDYYQAQADYNYSAEVFNGTRDIYMRKYDAARSAEEIDAEIDAAERGEIELTPTEKQALLVEKRFAEDKNARRIAENALEYVDGNGLADVPKIESVMTSSQTRLEEIDKRIEEIDLDIKNQDFLIDYTLKADVLTDADKLYIEEQDQIKANLQKEKDALLKERETVADENKNATEVYSYIWGSTFLQMQKDENFADKVAKGKERYDAEYQAFQDEVTNDRAFKTTVALTPEEDLYYELAPYYSAGRRKHPIAVDITMLSQEEQDNFYYLCAIGQDQLAVEYVQQIAMNDRRETLNEIADWAGTNTGTRLLASIGSVLLLPVSGSDMQLYGANMAWSGASGGIGIGATGDALIGGVAQGLTEKGIFNTGWGAGTIDEKVPIVGGIGLGDIYQLGMSMADSYVSARLFGAGATIMLGSKAASSAFNDAINKGASYEQAVEQGLAQGIAEALFEYISIDKLLNGDITAGMVKRVLQQAGVEASEEILTSIANSITDRAIMKDLSEFETTKREYMEQGYSEIEAEQIATREMWEGIAFDGIGGLLSGGGMALMYSGTIAKQKEFQDYMEKWADAALKFDPSSDIYQEGFKMQALLKSGEEISEEYMQGIYNRIGKDGFSQVSARVNTAEAVEQAEGRIGDIDQTFFNPETAVTDVYDTIDAYKEVANTAIQEKNASQLLVTTANALKMLDAAQTNLESALEQGMIDQNAYSDMRQIVEDARSRAQEILDLYMNQSRSAGMAGLSTEMQPVQEQQEANGVGMQAYLDAGASEAEAISAGEILDGILRGEITSETISSNQIGKLLANKDYGRNAISAALGVEVTREATASKQRSAVKAAIAQYEASAAQRQNTAAGAMRQENITPEGVTTNETEGKQSVRGDEGRQGVVDPGEQAGIVGESGSQRASDIEGTANITEAERKSLRKRKLNRQVERFDEVTAYKNASEVFGSEKYEGDIAEIPEEYYTEGMKDAAEKLAKDGVRVRYFKGTLMSETHDGRMRRTPGLFRAGTNEVWASVSSARFTPEQLAMHEYYHALVNMGKANVEQTVQEIKGKFSPEEFDRIVEQYLKDYRGAYEGDKTEDIYEELLADAYAGMNRFAQEKSAVQYQDVVRDQTQRGTNENERATRDTRGAPESKFSFAGERSKTADIRYSFEEDVAELDEEYRQVMDSEPVPHRTAGDLRREIRDTIERGSRQDQATEPTATVTRNVPAGEFYPEGTTVTHTYGRGKPFYSKTTNLSPKEALSYLQAATGVKWRIEPMRKGLWKAVMTTEKLDTGYAPVGYNKAVKELRAVDKNAQVPTVKEFAEQKLAEGWRDQNAPSAATVHAEGIKKSDFTASKALNKIGVKIDGSVSDYSITQNMRSAEEARRRIVREIYKAEKYWDATKAEKQVAVDIANGDLSYFDIPDSCRFDVVSELAALRMDERMAGNNLVQQRRYAIRDSLLEKAMDMFPNAEKIAQDPKLFNPSALLVMNYRTAQRNMMKIFGDELGAELYEYYFAPVTRNEASRQRWMNEQFDKVRKFEGSDGKTKKLTRAESAYVHELLDLEGYVQKVNESAKKDDIIEAAQELGDPKNAEENTILDMAVKYDLDKEQTSWMVKYAQWIAMQEGYSGKVDVERCKAAAAVYRQLFDDYFEAINDFLVAHGANPIGKIEGYTPHITANDKVNLLSNALEQLGFNANATRLPAEIAGRTEEFRPNRRWTPFFEHRTGDRTDYDIVKGFESYVTYISDVLFHMDDIQKIRSAEEYLRQGVSGTFETSIQEAIDMSRSGNTEDRIDYLKDLGRIRDAEYDDFSKEEINEAFDTLIKEMIGERQENTRYSDMVVWLQNYANVLAGKQFGGDRGTEHMGGRNFLTFGNKINAVFARANVAGNLSSALNQMAQLPTLLSERRATSVAHALGEFMTGKLREFAMESDFLTSKKGVNYITRTVGEMTLEGIFKPTEFMDSMLSTLVVRSAYLDAVKDGMSHEAAMRYADNYGQKIMADRSKGAKPLAFHSKGAVKQMLNMFQVEALNSWEHISQDLPRDFRQIARDGGKAKAARALALTLLKYLIAAFVLNRWTEEEYGGTPAPFDLFGMTANFIASGNGLTTNEWIKRTINKVTGVDIFEESSYEAFDEFDWGAAAEDTIYNLTNEIPFVSNISGMLGLGDRTLPTALPGIVDAVTGIYDAASENGVFSDDTALALVELLKSTIPGGRQIGKTIGGIRAAIEGGKMNGTGENERLQYVTDDSVLGIIQQVLFGVNATEEAKAHYASGENGLTARQTQMWKEITEQDGDGTELFELIQGHRRIGNDDTLASAARSEQQRNAIAGSSFTDKQKAYIYSVLFGDKDGTAQDEPFGELMDAGMSWDAITEMFNEYKRIYNDDSIGASEQTTEFQYWIDKKKYTKQQREIINDSFRYGRYSSVDPNESNYSKLVAQGVSPEDAKRIVENTTASDGEGVKQQDKVDAILKQNMSDDKTYAALGAVLNENAYDALTEARAAGISCRVFMEFRSKAENMKAEKDPNDPEKTIAGSKKEKVVELIDSLQLTTEQKDVLYLMYYAESGLYDTPWH